MQKPVSWQDSLFFIYVTAFQVQSRFNIDQRLEIVDLSLFILIVFKFINLITYQNLLLGNDIFIHKDEKEASY